MSERDYILGTHAAEVERLLLQHRVWRPRMLDAWRRAGITQGQTVIDVGSGPGYAALDLAEIVGPKGSVLAVERSARFLHALEATAADRELTNIKTLEADITETAIEEAFADAAWCRWVFSWLTKPECGVANIARALKPGGVAVFHEYLNYATWSLLPHDAAFASFVKAVIDSVAATGATIDSARALPDQLEQAAFARAYKDKLVTGGLLAAAEADAAIAALARAEHKGGTRMATPIVLEIIARRR